MLRRGDFVLTEQPKNSLFKKAFNTKLELYTNKTNSRGEHFR